MDEKMLSEIGAVAIIFIFCVKEFFSYLKTKKNGGDGTAKAILGQLTKMNENHLHDLRNCIDSGNRELIKTIHDDNTKMIEILGRIEGKLSK